MLEIAHLAYGEQLVLWTARRWLAGRHGWDRVAEEYALALGCGRARVALGAVEMLLDHLHRRARQTVYLHGLDCCRVSGDEQTLLAALASLQEGETRRAIALFEYLFRPDDARAALGPAEVFAGALAAAGHILPARCRAETNLVCAAAGDRPGATLH